jgi:K+:H+ antiporter
MENWPVTAHIELALLRVIVQLIVIIAVGRIAGQAFRRFGQPAVCGEIAGGLLLGPSVFGRLSPEAFHALFDSSSGQIFSILSQVGLVLMMFLIGLEFDFGHLSNNRRTAVSVSALGILLPFSLGFGVGHWMYGELGLPGWSINFSLFMAAAMSITAIPVLGRIILELNLNRTRIGCLAIAAAALDDAAGWIILALVTAFARSIFDFHALAIMVGLLSLYAMVMLVFVRPLISRWARAQLQGNQGDLSLNALATILVLVFASAAITGIIGIFSIFGAFLFGAILYDEHELREALRKRLHDFVTVFFLPIFFTYTGLRTDINAMTGLTIWGFCGVVLATAIIGKFGGCMLAAKVHGLPLRESAAIGAMMNTRGLMELIVINIGYDLGIIPKSVFFMLVIMALVTTYMTTPLLRRFLRNTEAWESYRASTFAARLEQA